MVFGVHSVLESFKSGQEVEKVLISKTLSNELIREMLTLANEHQIPVSKVPVGKLNRITRKNHQGVICFLSHIEYTSLEFVVNDAFQKGKDPLLLILDRITDVRNFGAIARTAECAGIDALVIPSKGGAQINSDAIKTSAGALHHIPVCREKNMKKSIQFLKDSGLRIFACTEKGNDQIYTLNFNVPAAIIMGSEENGISAEYLRMADDLVNIPILGKIESLNVSVATAVIVYEAIRQRSG